MNLPTFVGLNQILLTMKSILSLLLVVICLSVNATTYVGDLYFPGQEEMDNFFIDNPDVTIIDGTIDITGLITNFDAFSNITEIHSILYLSNLFEVESILGFSNLTYLGGLEINGDFAPNVSSLYGFHNLQYLGAFGLHYTNSITDISAINGVQGITDLVFNECHNLVFDNVFPNITELTYFYFSDPYHHTKFSGLNNVTYASHIYFEETFTLLNGWANLDSLDAFHNLTSASEIVMLMESPNYFNCFQNLQSVDNLNCDFIDPLDVPEFPSLTSANTITLPNGNPEIPAPSFNSLIDLYELNLEYSYYASINLESLETIGGPLTVNSQNSGYSSIISPNLTYIGGTTIIEYSVISDLSFLENVTSVGGVMYINGNYNLSDCDIYLFCEESGFYLPWDLSLSDNAPGCNFISEIEVSCISSSVTGSVYADINCNGTLDNDEPVLNGFPVFDQNQVPIGTAFANGDFWAPLPDNSTTTLSMGLVPGFEPSPTIELITGNDPIEFTDMNIGLCPLTDYHNLGTSLVAIQDPRPGFYTGLEVIVYNTGSSTENFNASLTIGNTSGFGFGFPQNNGVVNGNVVNWNNMTIEPYDHLVLTVYLATDPDVGLGTFVNLTAELEVVGNSDYYTPDNTSVWNLEVIGSFDPNDKNVNLQHVNVDSTDMESIELVYTIRFQNTGTAEAINVVVNDSISELLELNTIRLIDTSHPCSMSFLENNVISWNFENILLPDSTSDEEGSHGYVQFGIEPKSINNLPLIIANQAAIYFDFNEAIITNETNTIFYTCPALLTITAADTLCAGSIEMAEASSGWLNYSWLIDGQLVAQGEYFNYAQLATGSHSVQVMAQSFECESIAETNIEVLATPELPVITQNGNTLSATGDGFFSWYLNGQPLPESSSDIEISESGIYAVQVTNGQCASELAVGEFLYISVSELIHSNLITCYPNPASDKLFIRSNGLSGASLSAELFDLSGKLIQSERLINGMAAMDMRVCDAGLYFCVVRNGGGEMVSVVKVVVGK
jgi:uncharacterized repeat protein (TIGR01451 family)